MAAIVTTGNRPADRRARLTEVQVPRWLFSADNHVDEPLDLWDKHLPDHLKHLAPRVEIEGSKAFIKVENTVITAFNVPDGFAAGEDGSRDVMKSRDSKRSPRRAPRTPGCEISIPTASGPR